MHYLHDGLPADPPAPVVAAFADATREALNNGAAHSGATEAEAVAEAANLDYEQALARYAGAFVSARAGGLDQAGVLADVVAERFAGCAAGLEEARAWHLAGVVAAGAGRGSPIWSRPG